MCLFCEGGTADEYLRKISHDIDSVGWHVVIVEVDRHHPLWGYTIGLTERFGHPELVVVDECCWEDLGSELNVIGARVAAGERSTPGDEVIDVDGKCKARVGAVHPEEWTTDRFASWLEYYGTRPWATTPSLSGSAPVGADERLWQDDAANPCWPADDLSLPPRERPAVLPRRPHRRRDTRRRGA